MHGQPGHDPARVECKGCGRPPGADEPVADLPDGWEGAALPAGWIGAMPDGAVCPGCQPAVWVPRCRGLIESVVGEPIDVECHEHKPGDEAMVCGWVDVSRPYFDHELPADWECPSCGSGEYELIGYFRP